ncbi:MAG: Lrp/AsnC ligand binding domain-containing protein [Dehalococcoidia bacterium]
METKAFILIETQVGRSGQVARELRNVPEVLSADAVTGTIDVIALIQADSISALAELVTSRIQGVRGVRRTITCVAAG